jgi:hypothetical protein
MTTEATGIIVRAYEDGLPVIYALVNELPSVEIRTPLPWLTVISWTYDKTVRNGMPPEVENQRMISLQDAIESSERPGFLRHAYSRTGNGKKELVYYIHDRDAFLAEFNAAVAGHPRYPIAIDFYEDPDWSDFSKLLDDFSAADPGGGV